MPVPTFTSNVVDPERVSCSVRFTPPEWSWYAQFSDLTVDLPVQATEVSSTRDTQTRCTRMRSSIQQPGLPRPVPTDLLSRTPVPDDGERLVPFAVASFDIRGEDVVTRRQQQG
jgi:hypothetical protein